MYLIYKRCMKEWHLITCVYVCVCVWNSLLFTIPMINFWIQWAYYLFLIEHFLKLLLVRQNDSIYIAFNLWLRFLGQDFPFLFCESKIYPFKWNLCFVVFRKWVMFRVSRQVWERKKDEINSVFHHLYFKLCLYLPFSTDNWDSLMTG